MNKLRAGNLLKTWINDMKTMISQSNETYKAIFYSAVSPFVRNSKKLNYFPILRSTQSSFEYFLRSF